LSTLPLSRGLVLCLFIAGCTRTAPPPEAAKPAVAVTPAVEIEPTVAVAPVAAKPPEPVALAEPVAPPAPVELTTPPVAAMPAEGTSWILAGEQGVVEIDLTGKPLRTLSTTSARSPRWVGGRTKVAYLAGKDDVFDDLRIIDRSDGSDRRVAMLPADPPCPREAYAGTDEVPPMMSLTNEDELWIDRTGAHACIVYADHEADLRTATRYMSVRFADAHIDARVSGHSEVCPLPDQDLPPACSSGRTPQEKVESPFPKREVESRSPSKRWLLVQAASELGDVLHRQFVLYDVDTKAIYPLPRDKPGAWPKAMKLDLRKGEGDTLIEGLEDVGGSEAITWIGDHHLVIGRTLFVAGETIVELPGDVAQ